MRSWHSHIDPIMIAPQPERDDSLDFRTIIDVVTSYGNGARCRLPELMLLATHPLGFDTRHTGELCHYQ